MHAAHQKEMMTMMEQGVLTPTGLDHSKMKMGESSAAMDHNDPNSVLVEPGETKELVWRFAANTGLEFACNIPGHSESGMMAEIDVMKQAGTGSLAASTTGDRKSTIMNSS